jgi:hypothetical protein
MTPVDATFNGIPVAELNESQRAEYERDLQADSKQVMDGIRAAEGPGPGDKGEPGDIGRVGEPRLIELHGPTAEQGPAGPDLETSPGLEKPVTQTYGPGSAPPDGYTAPEQPVYVMRPPESTPMTPYFKDQQQPEADASTSAQISGSTLTPGAAAPKDDEYPDNFNVRPRVARTHALNRLEQAQELPELPMGRVYIEPKASDTEIHAFRDVDGRTMQVVDSFDGLYKTPA